MLIQTLPPNKTYRRQKWKNPFWPNKIMWMLTMDHLRFQTFLNIPTSVNKKDATDISEHCNKCPEIDAKKLKLWIRKSVKNIFAALAYIAKSLYTIWKWFFPYQHPKSLYSPKFSYFHIEPPNYISLTKYPPSISCCLFCNNKQMKINFYPSLAAPTAAQLQEQCSPAGDGRRWG